MYEHEGIFACERRFYVVDVVCGCTSLCCGEYIERV